MACRKEHDAIRLAIAFSLERYIFLSPIFQDLQPLRTNRPEALNQYIRSMQEYERPSDEQSMKPILLTFALLCGALHSAESGFAGRPGAVGTDYEKGEGLRLVLMSRVDLEKGVRNGVVFERAGSSLRFVGCHDGGAWPPPERTF